MLKPYTLVPAMSHLHRYNKTQVFRWGVGMWGCGDVGKGVGLVLGVGVGGGNGQKVGNQRPKYLSHFLDKYIDTRSRDFSIL